MRFVLATDGSAGSIRAAVRLRSLLRAGDHVLVLTAVPPADNLADAASAIEGEPARAAARRIAAARQALGAEDAWTVEELTVDGAPAAAICAVAERARADLVVVGHRGLGGLAALVLGSVSEQVCHRAPTSVLVVK